MAAEIKVASFTWEYDFQRKAERDAKLVVSNIAVKH